MNIDTWHQWLLLRPLFLVVMVAALLAAASLIRWYNAWRDTSRGKTWAPTQVGDSESRYGLRNCPDGISLRVLYTMPSDLDAIFICDPIHCFHGDGNQRTHRREA